MKANDRKIKDILEGKYNTFVVPPYQRKYTWKATDQVQELIDDINKFIVALENDEKDSYFLGSVVIKSSTTAGSNFNILVDGQQRITTFLLMLAALKKVAKDDLVTVAKIDAILESETNKFKLSKIESEDTVKKLLNGEFDEINKEDKDTLYYKNFQYLVNYFDKKEVITGEDGKPVLDEKGNPKYISVVDTDKFFNKGLYNIIVAAIYLDEKEDEFLVFESINSKGKPLSSADLIKNFIMMRLNDSDLEKRFDNKILSKLEGHNNNETPDFYRQVMAVLTGKLESKNGKGLYYAFRKKYGENDINEDFINDLEKHVIVWRFLHDSTLPKESLPFVKGAFLNFYSIAHAYLLNNCIIDEETKEIAPESQEEFYKVLKVISSVIVKRTLVEVGRVESNRTYASIGHKTYSNKYGPKEISEAFNSLDGIARTPSWDEIRENSLTTDLYTSKRSLLKWILISVEEDISGKRLDENDVNIEHIFPQNPDEDAWPTSAEEQLDISKNYLHDLGNLSLADKNVNSAMGNKYHERKNEILSERSYLKINKFVYEQDDWGKNEIIARHKSILDLIQQIWK